MILLGIDFVHLGLFGSHKSTKRKKKVQGPPLQATSSQAELATPEAKTSQGTYSQDEVATPEAETTDLGVVNSQVNIIHVFSFWILLCKKCCNKDNMALCFTTGRSPYF